MKRKIVIVIIVAIYLVPGIALSVETFYSKYIEDSASITIDGDISDWTRLEISPALFQIDVGNSPNPPQGMNDFSAQFRSVMDAHFVYVLVEVTDDILIFGEEKLGKAFWDDSIMIHFPNKRCMNSRVSIAISSDENNKTKIEYYEWPANLRFPYILEILGVQSVLRKNANGYVIEVAIPLDVLSIDDFEGSFQTGVNVEVFDDDDGEDHESAFLLDYRGWWNPNWYYPKLLFEKSRQQMVDAKNNLSENKGSSSIVIELGAPTETNEKEMIYSILNDMSNNAMSSAEEKLLLCPDEIWVKPMLAWVQMVESKTDSAIKTLFEITKGSYEEYINIWAKDYLGLMYKQKKDFTSAKKIYQELLVSSNWNIYRHAVSGLAECEGKTRGYKAAVKIYENEQRKKPLHPILLLEQGSLYHKNKKYDKALEVYEDALLKTQNTRYKYLTLMKMARVYIDKKDCLSAVHSLQQITELYPYDLQILKEVAFEMSRAKNYQEAIDMYSKIEQKTDDVSEKTKIQLEIARNYFYNNEIEKSMDVCNRIINENSDSKITLEAKMILLSIEKAR